MSGCGHCVAGATISCSPTSCVCVPSFFDANCSSSFFAARPDLFVAYNGLTLTLYLLLAAFGCVLAVVYFVRVLPQNRTSLWSNPQVLGILALILACLFRFINSALYLGYGSSVGFVYFQSPTSVYGVIEGFFELFYPLVIAAFALQIVLWMIFVVKSNQSKRTNSCWKPPVLAGFYFSFLALLLIFSIVTAILTVNLSASSYGFQLFYRIYLAVYLLGLLAVAVIFAVQMLLALAEVEALSEDFRRRRRRLAVFVLITCCILLAGVIVALAQISPTVSANPDVYYGLQFLNLFIEVSAIGSIYATFVFILQSLIADSGEETVDTRSLEQATSSSHKLDRSGEL